MDHHGRFVSRPHSRVKLMSQEHVPLPPVTAHVHPMPDHVQPGKPAAFGILSSLRHGPLLQSTMSLSRDRFSISSSITMSRSESRGPRPAHFHT